MAFLSLLDDRAKPKGSRDPLGFELTWSYFGRRVIGNLTTITSSLDNFAVALLGFYWSNQLNESIEEQNRHKPIRDTFLRYEQLVDYIRYFGNAKDIMGITRVRQRLSDDTFKITLGVGANQQILSDQVSYGLWGLYSSAARDTNLVSGNDRLVTELGIEIADTIIRCLGETANTLLTLLQSNKPLDRKQLQALAPAFKKAIQHKDVQAPLLEALMSGRDKARIQRELWEITQSIFRGRQRNPKTVPEFIDAVLAKKTSQALSQALHEIMSVERVLVAANNIFHYCRRKDGEKVGQILDELGRYYYHYLPETLPAESFPHKEQLQSMLMAFRNSNHEQVLREVLDLNKKVMQQRSGAAWVEVVSGKTLRVRVKSEKAELRKQKALEIDWDYDYFLGSYLNIAQMQLGGGNG